MLEGFESLLTPGPEREAATVSRVGLGGARGCHFWILCITLGFQVPAGLALLCSPPFSSPKLDNSSEREEFPSPQEGGLLWAFKGFFKHSFNTPPPTPTGQLCSPGGVCNAYALVE